MKPYRPHPPYPSQPLYPYPTSTIAQALASRLEGISSTGGVRLVRVFTRYNRDGWPRDGGGEGGQSQEPLEKSIVAFPSESGPGLVGIEGSKPVPEAGGAVCVPVTKWRARK
jgi:hypothetical protein